MVYAFDNHYNRRRSFNIFRIAICEDDPQQAKITKALLLKYNAERPYVDIYSLSFESGSELFKSLDAGNYFDLFLLDIMMPELNGIEIARMLRARYADITVVFLTSSVDYALDAFRVSAMQYLLKPIEDSKLFTVLDKVTARLKQKEEKFFTLQMIERTIKIPFSAIVCVELVNRALQFSLANGNTLSGKSIRSSFAAAVSPLIQDSRFIYPHNSFVLNMAYVEELSVSFFHMKNGVKIPIPRYNRVAAREKYFAYLSAQGMGFMEDL